MGQKIKLDDKEHDVENFSDKATTFAFIVRNEANAELTNMNILQRAKNSYVQSLKQKWSQTRLVSCSETIKRGKN